MRRSPSLFAGTLLLVLTASCTTPDVAPAADVAAPVVAQPEVSTVEVAHVEAPAADPAPTPPATPAPTPPAPAPDSTTPWGAPLEITGKSHGLQWTTTAQVQRTGTTLQLALDLQLHNTTRARMPVSPFSPLASVMLTPAPGATDARPGLGLGMRGEGFGSDVCSPGHGGPLDLRPGDRTSVQRKLVELDPLPWPAGQAFRITASSRDCRPGRLTLEVADVMVVPPATPDGVPTLMAANPSAAN